MTPYLCLCLVVVLHLTLAQDSSTASSSTAGATTGSTSGATSEATSGTTSGATAGTTAGETGSTVAPTTVASGPASLTSSGCYCPGDPIKIAPLPKSQQDEILHRISYLRRLERQNFTMYTPAEESLTSGSLRSTVPTPEQMAVMFPGEDMSAWLAVNSISPESVATLKAKVKSSLAERMILKNKILDYLKYFPTTTTTTTTTSTTTTTLSTLAAEAGTGSTVSSSSENSSLGSTQTSTQFSTEATTPQARRKRALPTNLGTRPDVTMILPMTTGMGIKAGNSTSVANSVPCWSCQIPSFRARKILKLYDSTDILDMTSTQFLQFKMKVETLFDNMFEAAMTDGTTSIEGGAKFNEAIGYYGSEVVAVYSPPAPGGRRKRANGDILVEVEVTAKDSSVTDAALDSIYTAATLTGISVKTAYDSTPSTCSMANLNYNKAVLQPIGITDVDNVPSGMKAFFACKPGNLMNETIDPEHNGFDVQCGYGGEWAVPSPWPDNVQGCIPTPMCSSIPPTSSLPPASGLELVPYTPVDTQGSILEGESVYYRCKDPAGQLDDGSGLGMYTATCHNSTVSPPVWPQCVEQLMCSTFPTPDTGGLELTSDDAIPLLPGEFAIYNCSTDGQVTDNGAMFLILCQYGELKPPAVWPECRDPLPCNTLDTGVPVPPDGTYLAPILPDTDVMETEDLFYNCTADPGKTWIRDSPTQKFSVKCLAGGVWEEPPADKWPVCLDTTTTTPEPTTVPPVTGRDCYCLGDIEPSNTETWQMNISRHQNILTVCRIAYVTFQTMVVQVDQNNNKYVVPVKEQCGVKNPYVKEYGIKQGLSREYNYDDLCACNKTRVYGYWVTMEILSQMYMPSLADPIKQSTKDLRMHIEETMDLLYLNGKGSVQGIFNHRYIRTRGMRFMEGFTILNKQLVLQDPTQPMNKSVRVMMEVQFAGSSPISLADFTKAHMDLISVNTTLSSKQGFISDYPGKGKGGGIVVNVTCPNVDNPNALDSCPITDPPTCLNKDFEAVPSYLTHQYVQKFPNGTGMPFPYNVTDANGNVAEFQLKVGELVNFVCVDPYGVQNFKTTEPDLLDNVLTVVCKPDRYFTVPQIWPICKAKCPAAKPLPGNGTLMILDTENKAMKDTWNQQFWEDDQVYYVCEDPKNFGVVTQPNLINPETGGQVGDRRETGLVFQCTNDGTYNTPRKFPNCAPKPNSCDCPGDLTPDQSFNVLNMICRDDPVLDGNFHYEMGADDTVGLLVLPNKTRCGVAKADYPSPEEKCYCYEKDLMGVKTGFWHIIDVLSLPYHPDLFWPNTTAFAEAKMMLEERLDEMYINSSVIFGRQYVRSLVMKFKVGNYQLKHLTSTTTTTTSTTTTTQPTTKPNRGRRQAPDNERDYVIDMENSTREDGKMFIGARGYFPYETEYSTQAWIEHQFMEDFDVNEFDYLDFETEHLRLLDEINGQWLDETDNMTLWLSQGCYISGKCFVEDLLRCDNAVLGNLPPGFTTDKPNHMVILDRESQVTKEYQVPVGGEISLYCSNPWQKINMDIWDNDPKDALLTVRCLPTFKFGIPVEEFPKCISFCPAPWRLWNGSTFGSDILPLQEALTLDPSETMPSPLDPRVGYRLLKPADYTGLVLNEQKTDWTAELWVGEKIYYTCTNSTLGVAQGDSPEVAFRCKDDGSYNVPTNDSWPPCDIKTSTAKPPIVNGLIIAMKFSDDKVTNDAIWADYLQAQAQGDLGNLFWKITVPVAICFALLVVACLLLTRHDSIFCQMCNKDFELKEMQNYGHSDYVYE